MAPEVLAFKEEEVVPLADAATGGRAFARLDAVGAINAEDPPLPAVLVRGLLLLPAADAMGVFDRCCCGVALPPAALVVGWWVLFPVSCARSGVI